MADVFDINQASWTYSAALSAMLYNTSLPLPPIPVGLRIPRPSHDTKYWARVTKGFDFSKEDRVDPEAFNRILWKGLKGDKTYPGDMNLAQTHERYKEALKKRNASDRDRDDDDD